MSTSSKFEARLLSHEDQQLVTSTHHPAIYQRTRGELNDMRQRLRGMRDRERTLLRQKRREIRGKAQPRGGGFPGTADLPGKRKQLFAQALRRVNSEIHRIDKLEARAAMGASARRALAMRRSGEKFRHPENERMGHLGPRSMPSSRRKSHVPGGQVGSVTKANARAQAARDGRSSP
jgi:hypothetical protein